MMPKYCAFLDLFTNTCIPFKHFPDSFYSVYSCMDIPLLKPMKHKIHNVYCHIMLTFRGLLPSCLNPYTRRSLSILKFSLSSTIQSLLVLQNEAKEMAQFRNGFLARRNLITECT